MPCPGFSRGGSPEARVRPAVARVRPPRARGSVTGAELPPPSGAPGPGVGPPPRAAAAFPRAELGVRLVQRYLVPGPGPGIPRRPDGRSDDPSALLRRPRGPRPHSPTPTANPPAQRRAPDRPAPRADGLAASGARRSEGRGCWGRERGSRQSRGGGPESRAPATRPVDRAGPETSETSASSAARRLRPGRPPRASGYPTLPSPPGRGGGFNVSHPGLTAPSLGGGLTGRSARGLPSNPGQTLSSPNCGLPNTRKRKTLTTLSGGSLGSCVDEERS